MIGRVKSDRTQFIASRLQEVLFDGKWIANTNFKDQIESIDWETAVLKVGELNTIAQLTFHINYYLEGILEVFSGGDLTIRDQFSFDMPEIKNQEDWTALRLRFISNAKSFVEQVQQMDDSILDQPFVKEAYGSYYRNLEGVIEHTYYHLGQVSLIRKLLAENFSEVTKKYRHQL